MKTFAYGYYHLDMMGTGSLKGEPYRNVRVVLSSYRSDHDGEIYQGHVDPEGKVLRFGRVSITGGYRSIKLDTAEGQRFALKFEAALADHLDRAEQAKVFPLDLDFGAHVFVQAHPRSRKWSDVDGTNGIFDHRDVEEFRPCMIRGEDKGQRLYVIGSAHTHDLADFVIKREPWMAPVTTAA